MLIGVGYRMVCLSYQRKRKKDDYQKIKFE
jgi:hypothetical protein